ncbi:phage portal protein [Paenibacillus validus]|uniref:phage portal protein n=1 Tax=Paenibacillus validus TaxID=44253 RepID=UPI001C3F9DC8|nr:phage portal protein [Paenibacillus validus]MED4599879.1 phage portal protein [Paenibacillus validus]MED4606088.1 phage portal protein [Paenibacillus validus]
MGIWKRAVSAVNALRGKNDVTAAKVIDLLNKGMPLSFFGRDLYNIPEVRTAINFIAEKVGSIPFYHARADNNGNIEMVNDRVQYVLTVRTNPYQSPQVFWTYVTTRLLLNNNVFIMPDWGDAGQLRALYVLPFSQFEFTQDEDDRLIIKFPYASSYQFYYDDIIHLQRFPTQLGGAQRQATGGYVQIVNTMQAQAVKDSENSQRIAALLQVKTQLKGTDMKKKLDEFKDLFLTSENTTGFGMIGAEYEVHNLDMKLNPLNKDVLEAIVSYLYLYFGVSREVVTNTATEIQYEQFIDNMIKPIVFQVEEELTYKLFSDTEIHHNNKILAELIDLEISTLSAKTTFFKEMLFGSVMTRNEIRKRIGLPRGPKELDNYMESKNFQTLDPGNYTVKGGETTDANGG